MLIGKENVKEGEFNLKQISIGNKCREPMYNLFIAIAKLFQQVEAKCITRYVPALPEGSNSIAMF